MSEIMHSDPSRKAHFLIDLSIQNGVLCFLGLISKTNGLTLPTMQDIAANDSLWKAMIRSAAMAPKDRREGDPVELSEFEGQSLLDHFYLNIDPRRDTGKIIKIIDDTKELVVCRFADDEDDDFKGHYKYLDSYHQRALRKGLDTARHKDDRLEKIIKETFLKQPITLKMDSK